MILPQRLQYAVLASSLLRSSSNLGRAWVPPMLTTTALSSSSRSMATSSLLSAAAATATLAPNQNATTTTNTANAKANANNNNNDDAIPVHLPVGADGQGVYSAETAGCFDVIAKATPLVLSSLDSVLERQEEQEQKDNNEDASLFTVADFGTADAGTSLGLLHQVCQRIRRRTSNNNSNNNRERQRQRPIQVSYEDQATNEWQSVFGHFAGTIQARDATGNVQLSPATVADTYVSAVGRSFFEPCYPPETLDLAVSFTAMHWLSRAPGSLSGNADYMHSAQVLSSGDDSAAADHTLVQAEVDQAASDWVQILRHRARELKPGARFVCVNFCRNAKGHFLGNTDVGDNMWESFDASWKQLYTDGLIDAKERDAVSFPNYYRTAAEFEEGIGQIDDLRLVSCEEAIVRCPYRSQVKTKSPEDYAAWFVPTTRTWSNATFRAALRSDRDNKDAILTQFWANYQALVTQNPAAHGMDYVHCYLVLEKV